METGRAAVDVMVNGRGPFRLLVETGSPVTILTEPAARHLGLARSPHDSTAMTGMVRLDSIRIGAARLDGLNALVFDRLPGPADGLLGLNGFQDLLVTLDYPARTLRLASGSLSPTDGREILEVTRAGPFWAVELDFGGRRVSAILDTEASMAFAVTPALAESLSFAAAPVVVGRALGPSIGDVERRAARLTGDVRVGSAVLERPIVDVLALPPMLRPPVLLGTQALQHFAVTLDQRQRLVRLESKAVGPVAPPPPLRSFGLSAPHAEDGLRRIYHVLPGSPADREGGRVGDEIVSADGRSAGELSEAELAGLGHLGRPVRFRLRRDGVEREVTLASFVQVD
ncbi:MAG: aspartyl protease family protein [Gemmatimonadales bacterium]